jgi:dihydrodipicolinate synthase/N-acetylneuraminate lyase
MNGTGDAVNEDGFRRMLRYMSGGGTGVFVGGLHATEFVHLDADERRRLWEVAVDELSGKGPVNALLLTSVSTQETIARVQLVKAIGFDGAQLHPAAQGGRGADGLFTLEVERFFRDVLESTDLPIYLCGYGGGEIIDSPTKQVPCDLLAQLAAEYPHIVGVTVTETDATQLDELIGALEHCPVRLAGAHDWFESMERGVYGFHSIQQSIAPNLCSKMMAAYHSGDKDLARELSGVIRALNDIIHTPRYYYPRSIKPILNHLGFEMGIIRRPFLPPPPDLQKEMGERVDALQLQQYGDHP